MSPGAQVRIVFKGVSEGNAEWKINQKSTQSCKENGYGKKQMAQKLETETKRTKTIKIVNRIVQGREEEKNEFLKELFYNNMKK